MGEPIELQTDEIVRTISFEPQVLQGLATRILRDGGPRAIRMRERRAGGRSVVFVARHEDATRVLKEESNFSLSHYAMLFKAVAPPGVRLLMAPETPDLKRQRSEFYDAATGMTNAALADAIAQPEVFDTNRAAIARNVVQALLACFQARDKPEFDIIGEYAYFAPYLIAREVFGVAGPQRPNLLVRLVAAARCLRGSFHRLTPETTPFLGAVYLAQFAFAQVFLNFENRLWYIRWIARRGASALAKHIRARLDLALLGYDPYPGSLLSCLSQRVKDGRVDRDHAVGLLVEMFGTAVLIPPSGFTGIVEWMIKQPGGIPAQLKDLDASNARAFVDEVLRLNPPSKYLLRTAVNNLRFGDFDVREGEFVCALIAQACRDPRIFKEKPDSFQVGRAVSSILHFGPMDGPHQCLGRELARDMVAEMLLGLKTLPELWPVDEQGIKTILGFPQLRMRWRRKARLKRGYGPHRTPAMTAADTGDHA